MSRAVSVLAWPLTRLRSLITGRVENELRREIRLLDERIEMTNQRIHTALAMQQNHIRTAEIAPLQTRIAEMQARSEAALATQQDRIRTAEIAPLHIRLEGMQAQIHAAVTAQKDHIGSAEIALLYTRLAEIQTSIETALAAQQDHIRTAEIAPLRARLAEVQAHIEAALAAQPDHIRTFEIAPLHKRLAELQAYVDTALRTQQDHIRTVALTPLHTRLAQMEAHIDTVLATQQDQIRINEIAPLYARISTVQAHVDAALATQRYHLRVDEIAPLLARVSEIKTHADLVLATRQHEFHAAETALQMRLLEMRTHVESALAAQLNRVYAAEIAIADAKIWNRSEAKDPTKPLFSIVLPTRDRAAQISDAIDSVLAQSCGDWELLIIDDGSSDDTAERLRPYLADPRIRSQRQEGRGECIARNAGLALARGELVAYVDSDNAWFPNFLAGMKAEFDAEPSLDCAYGVLVMDAAYGESRILWAPFDRAALEASNFIDLNVFVHRRELVARHGGFDESLRRMSDWDLVLNYTADNRCRRAPVAAAYYRTRSPGRISDTQSAGDHWFRIQCKHRTHATPARRPRALYAVWHYPQLSETYVETELRAMLRFGVDIEVWSADDVAVSYPAPVPVRRGTLEQAIAGFGPDVIHVHWLNSAVNYSDAAEAAGVPMTVRAHGFEVDAQSLAALLQSPVLERLLLFPHQKDLLPQPDARVVFAKSVFDTTLFAPARKNRRMVLRAGSALPSKDLRLFFEAAKCLPQFRFVLLACTTYQREYYVDEIRKLKAEVASPAELHFDLPHEQAAEYVGEAAIYLHTAADPTDPYFTPIGMPISIAEAMATGAYVLVRDLPALRDYVGPAGATYADLNQACSLIRATEQWDERRWRSAERLSIDRAFFEHADTIVLRPLYEDWVRLAKHRDSRLPP